MFERQPKEDTLSIIKAIEADPATTQRILSEKLGISLGKTNYLIKELIRTGMIKVRGFSHNPGKLRKINYILTKKGFETKARLLYHFLQRKEKEYNSIKKEWDYLMANNGNGQRVQKAAK